MNTPKTVTKLYAKFRKVLAGMEALPSPRSDTDEKLYDAALALCSKLCDRIIATRADPANPVPEMLMKIAAGGWFNGTSEPLDRWTECADGDIADCLVSIRKDLQAMQVAPPRRGKPTRTLPVRHAASI